MLWCNIERFFVKVSVIMYCKVVYISVNFYLLKEALKVYISFSCAYIYSKCPWWLWPPVTENLCVPCYFCSPQANAQIILSCQRCYDNHNVMLPVVTMALQNLWKDAGVRRAVSRGYEYELNDSAI